MTESGQDIDAGNTVELAELETSSRVVAYALGQLEPGERSEFERRIAEDPELADQVEEERAFARALQTALPSGMPREGAFTALELGDAPKRHTFQYGLAAALAILGLGLMLSMPEPEPDYETLSSGSDIVAPYGYSYRVVLTGEAAANARNWLAQDYELNVIDGVDTMLVLSRNKPLSANELKTLRNHPSVALLEPQFVE